MTRLGLGRLDLLAIATGGVAGAIVRWSISARSESVEGGWFVYTPNTNPSPYKGSLDLPVAVLGVNLFGCLLLGGLTLALTRTSAGGRRRLLIALAVGFCGSLTTFSTFAVDTADLLGARIEPQPGTALLYVALSVAGGAFAFAIGRRVGKSLTRPAIP